MSKEIPGQLPDNLVEGEEVKRSLETRSLLQSRVHFPDQTADNIIQPENTWEFRSHRYTVLPVVCDEGGEGRDSFGSMIFTSVDGNEILLKKSLKTSSRILSWLSRCHKQRGC